MGQVIQCQTNVFSKILSNSRLHDISKTHQMQIQSKLSKKEYPNNMPVCLATGAKDIQSRTDHCRRPKDPLEKTQPSRWSRC